MIDFENTPHIKEWLGSGSINFFGLPFAGKDSQARRLADRLKGVVLSSGDILRNSVIPPETKAIMAAGGIAPSKDFVNIVLPYLKKPEFSGHPLMLSSVGRWHGEEEGVIGALDESQHPLKAVVYLKLDAKIAIERLNLEENVLERGIREDDGKEKFLTRIEEFNQKTMPVIEYYRDSGLLIEVDASLPKDEVERVILEQLALRTEDN
jgi:adenylate kinase